MDGSLDVAAEQQRVAAAIDASGVAARAVATRGCDVCGAPPGAECIATGLGSASVPRRVEPHVARIEGYRRSGPASLATVPDATDTARLGLQAAVKAQLLAMCEGELNAKTLDRIQRFCASMGQAMIGLEKPDMLVRDRFGRNGLGLNTLPGVTFPSYVGYGEDSDTASLAPSPGVETYGANASRGLIAEATRIGKDLIEAQIEGQKATRRLSTLPELVASLVLAKKQKLGKTVIDALEKQISDASKSDEAPASGGA